MGKGLLVVNLDLARLPIKVSDKPIFTEIPRTSADMLWRGQMDAHLPSEKSVSGFVEGYYSRVQTSMSIYIPESSLLLSCSFSCAQVQARMHVCTRSCGCKFLCACSIIMDY